MSTTEGDAYDYDSTEQIAFENLSSELSDANDKIKMQADTIKGLRLTISTVQRMMTDAVGDEENAAIVTSLRFLRRALCHEMPAEWTDAQMLNGALVKMARQQEKIEELRKDQTDITNIIDDVNETLITAGFNADSVPDRVDRVLKLLADMRTERDDASLERDSLREQIATLTAFYEHIRTETKMNADASMKDTIDVFNIIWRGYHTGRDSMRKEIEMRDQWIAGRDATIATLTAERDEAREELGSVLSDWNALVKASGSLTHGAAIGVVARLRADVERLTKERDGKQQAVDIALRNYDRLTADNARHLAAIETLRAFVTEAHDGLENMHHGTPMRLRAKARGILTADYAKKADPFTTASVDTTPSATRHVLEFERPVEKLKETAADIFRRHHEQIETEVQKLIAAGVSRDRMKIQTGLTEQGMPRAFIVVDGVRVADFEVKMIMPAAAPAPSPDCPRDPPCATTGFHAVDECTPHPSSTTRTEIRAVTAPVCKKCGDTHTMFHSGLERDVMCTSCPTPCSKCRQGAQRVGVGLGAYCETTPCACTCHTVTS